MKIEKLFPVKTKIVKRQGKMLEVINEEIFQVLIIISVVAGDVVENFMIISPDFFPPLGFDKLPDFFSRDFFARNLGKNLFLIKLKIWERNFVVFPLILANDVFEMFQSGIFLKPRCFVSFKNKLRSFKEFFFWVGIGIGHFSFQRKFFEFFKGKRGRVEKCHFSRLKLPFFKTFSCADFDVVVVKKRFLGHHQKFEKVPLKSADKNKF